MDAASNRRGRYSSKPDDGVYLSHIRKITGERKTSLARGYGISRETLYKYLRR